MLKCQAKMFLQKESTDVVCEHVCVHLCVRIYYILLTQMQMASLHSYKKWGGLRGKQPRASFLTADNARFLCH